MGNGKTDCEIPGLKIVIAMGALCNFAARAGTGNFSSAFSSKHFFSLFARTALLYFFNIVICNALKNFRLTLLWELTVLVPVSPKQFLSDRQLSRANYSVPRRLTPVIRS